MRYEQTSSTQANTIDPPSSLMEDASRICGELIEIRDRLSKIADALHGPHPVAVGDEKNAPEPIKTVRRETDKSLMWLDRVRQEVTRIESRI